MSLEAEQDLKQFLKVVRPEWSSHRRCGRSDVARVLQKLKAIGITDTTELLNRTMKNTINEDLLEAGKARLSRETLQAIRRHGVFINTLEHMREPTFRQIGLFEPVPQLFVAENRRARALKKGDTMLVPETGLASRAPSRGAASGSRPASRAVSPASTTANQPKSTDFPALRPVSSDECSEQSFVATWPRSRPSSCGKTLAGGRDLLEPLPGLRGLWPKSRRHERSLRHRPELMHASAPSLSSTSSTAGAWMHHGSSPRSSFLNTAGSVSTLASSLQASGDGCPSRRPDRRLLSPSSASLTGLSFASQERLNFDDSETDFEEECLDQELTLRAGRWNKAGASMANTGRRPQWSSLYDDSALVQHGEAMLKEQEALDTKKRLFQDMHTEGKESKLRQHIAKKIQNRLQEERLHDVQAAVDMSQCCASIRKNIQAMVNSRRILSGIKVDAKNIVEPRVDMNLAATMMEKFKDHHKDPQATT